MSNSIKDNANKTQDNILGTSGTGGGGGGIPPTVQRFAAGPSNPFAPQMVYLFTVPAGCKYFTCLLIAGGGCGGQEIQQVSLINWQGGGGGAGAWAKLMVTDADFTAGSTQYYMYVGCGATNTPAWAMTSGGDTELRTALLATLVSVEGGKSAPHNQFEGDGGDGGQLLLDVNNYVTSHNEGQRGMKAKHWGPLFPPITERSETGDGGFSPYGAAGTKVYKGAFVDSNGRDAFGYAAGGSGACNGNLASNTFYGGAGAPGFAEVTFYYQ